MDPTSKFICLPCFENLGVAYKFKQQCKESMAVNRLRATKMVFKCEICTSCFDNSKKLEQHSVSHSIDLTESDQKTATSPHRIEQEMHKTEQKCSSGLMYFKIPRLLSKQQTSSASHSKPSLHSTSKSHHNLSLQSGPKKHHSSKSLHVPAPPGITKFQKHASNNLTFNFKCSICKHQFKTRSALASHIPWHDKKEYQFKCPNCSLVFIKRGHMEEHIRHLH